MQIAAILPNDQDFGVKEAGRAGRDKNKQANEEMPFGEVMQQLNRKSEDEASARSKMNQANEAKTKDSEADSKAHKKTEENHILRELQEKLREKTSGAKPANLAEKADSKLQSMLEKAKENSAKSQEGVKKTANQSEVGAKKTQEETNKLKGELSKAQAEEALKKGTLEKADKNASQASAFKNKLEDLVNKNKDQEGEDKKTISAGVKADAKDGKTDGKTDSKEKAQAGEKTLSNESQKNTKAKAEASFKEELGDLEKSQKAPKSKENTVLSPDKVQSERSETTFRMPETARVNNQPRILPEQTIEQIIDKFRVLIDGKNKTLEVHLKPASLGKVQIALQSIDGIVTARIIAENTRTVGLLDTNIQQIKDDLESQGIKVDDFEVNAGKEEQGGFTDRENDKNNKRSISQMNLANKDAELLNELRHDSTIISGRLDVLA